MAAYNIVVAAAKDGTADAESITVAFDDSTDIARTVELVNEETGASVALKLNGDTRNLRLEFSSDVDLKRRAASA